MRPNSLVELDRAHLIHPVISWAKHEARGPTVSRSARGVYLTDENGNGLRDGFAGLWCANVGYGHESIVAAATEQLRRLPYATGYFHFASESAIRLAATLADLAPGDLNHVFFTLGGSDAVDSAVKTVRSYFNVRGRSLGGLLAGIELVVDKSLKTKPPPALSVHERLARIGYAYGLIFRAFGDDIIGLAPPLCMTLTETELLLSRL